MIAVSVEISTPVPTNGSKALLEGYTCWIHMKPVQRAATIVRICYLKGEKHRLATIRTLIEKHLVALTEGTCGSTLLREQIEDQNEVSGRKTPVQVGKKAFDHTTIYPDNRARPDSLLNSCPRQVVYRRMLCLVPYSSTATAHDLPSH
jgi:hypothetical protein